MKLLAMLLLSGNLFLANSDVESVEPSVEPTEEISEIVSEEISEEVSVESSDVVSEEVSDEVVEQEQTELQKLLEQWLNGEIELDDITLEKVYEKLGSISEEEIDNILQKYIEDNEERQKLKTIITAVLTALLSALVVAIYLHKIKKQGVTATLNNKTFSESSKVMEKSVEDLKEGFSDMQEIVKSNSDRLDKLTEAIKLSGELTDKQLRGVLGVLKIHYKGVDEDEQGKTSQKE